MPSLDKDDIAEISNKSSSSICDNIDNADNISILTCSRSHHDNKSFDASEIGNNEVTSFDLSYVSNKIEESNISDVNILENVNEDAVSTTSSHCNISTGNLNLSKVATPASSSYINNRFTPGFTPKAKKRKFLGPAGFLEFVSLKF